MANALAMTWPAVLVQADRDMMKEKVDVQTLQLQRAQTACAQLIKGHEYRKGEAKAVRSKVLLEINDRFNNFLKRRRHSGRIKIQYDDHELDMEVRCLPCCKLAPFPSSAAFGGAFVAFLKACMYQRCRVCMLVLIRMVQLAQSLASD